MSYKVSVLMEERDEGWFVFGQGEDGDNLGGVGPFDTEDEARRAGADLVAMMDAHIRSLN